MDNITSLEICELRPFFSTAFNHLKAFETNARNAERDQEEDSSGAADDSYRYSDTMDE